MYKQQHNLYFDPFSILAFSAILKAKYERASNSFLKM